MIECVLGKAHEHLTTFDIHGCDWDDKSGIQIVKALERNNVTGLLELCI